MVLARNQVKTQWGRGGSKSGVSKSTAGAENGLRGYALPLLKACLLNHPPTLSVGGILEFPGVDNLSGPKWSGNAAGSVGQLAWLAWLASWPVGRLVGWPVGRLASWPVGQLAWLASWPGWPVGQFASWPVGRLVLENVVGLEEDPLLLRGGFLHWWDTHFC